MKMVSYLTKKKLTISILLAFVLIFSMLAGCSRDKVDPTLDPNQSPPVDTEELTPSPDVSEGPDEEDQTPEPTLEPSPSQDADPEATPTAKATEEPTASPSPSPSPKPSPSPTATAKPTQTPKPEATPTPKATEAPTPTPVADRLNINVLNPKHAEGKLAVWFFTLPSENHTGSSILIKTPGNKTILVDGSIDEGARLVVKYLGQLGITRLDYIVATHMHIDHVGGFPRILNSVSLGQALGTTFTDYNTSAVRNFFKSLAERNVAYQPVTKGHTIQLEKDLTLEVLYPFGEFTVGEGDNPQENEWLNNTSVVFKLKYKNKSFLLTGDIHQAVEFDLIDEYGKKLESDVMLVPHHGASSSSSTAFIKAVAPKYAVSQTATVNDYNLINKYKAMGVNITVTSLDGTVLFLTDGEQIQYATSK